jgi:hypothetical protein
MMKGFTDANGRSLSCIVLEGKSNYEAWAFTVKEHLITNNLFEFVSTDCPEGSSVQQIDANGAAADEAAKPSPHR